VKFYPAAPPDAIRAGQAPAGDAGQVIAIRAADLMSPLGQPPAGGERTALVVAGTPRIQTGDQLAV
jgi:hypothetical protein